MSQPYSPPAYKPLLSVLETEAALKALKDYFERDLAHTLHLIRVSAPLFVYPESGLNDDLNGVERPVSFGILEQHDRPCQVVHSLAKWKRSALAHYGIAPGQGIYTDMNAIRRDETTDNVHSLYVDQWDWEKVIPQTERTEATLRATVEAIYGVILRAEAYMAERYDCLTRRLPSRIAFATAQDLEDKYPELSPKERELAAVKETGALFLMQIGGALQSGVPHDGRAPDYDDWTMNGDLLVYYDLLDCALELSSMGIRVDAHALKRQLALSGCEERLKNPYCTGIIKGTLPASIGGGIGQPRLCLLLLRKAHIGEVQASLWPPETVQACASQGIPLL